MLRATYVPCMCIECMYVLGTSTLHEYSRTFLSVGKRSIIVVYRYVVGYRYVPRAPAPGRRSTTRAGLDQSLEPPSIPVYTDSITILSMSAKGWPN